MERLAFIMNKETIKHFCKPDPKKVLLFLTIPVGYMVILFPLNPFIGSIGNTLAGLVVQTILGIFIFVGVAPFGVVAAISGAFGIHFSTQKG